MTKLESVHARIVQLSQHYKKSKITTTLSDGKLLVTAELSHPSFYSAVHTEIRRAATGSHSKCKLIIKEQWQENKLSLQFSL